MRRPDGRLVYVCGASRTGKTIWTAQQVASARRLLVWDAVGEWHRYGCQPISDPAELRDRVKPPARLERIAYVRPVTPAEFSAFCRLAWVWLRVARGALVVEELADVTPPGKAPAAWGEIVRKGLRYGPDIFALTQRPAESDKTTIGNATTLHSHAMRTPRDRAYIADHLGAELELVAGLAPLEYLERDGLGALRRGRVRLPGLRARRAN